MNVALVHDDLTQLGGAERVAAAFHDLYPESPLYTSRYDAAKTLDCFKTMDIRTSFLQSSPLASQALRAFALNFTPMAFEQFDFDAYDLVLSSSRNFAEGVYTRPETCHICYCHSPGRFGRREGGDAARALPRLLLPLLRGAARTKRASDIKRTDRIDYIVANSYHVARRIRKSRGREVAAVIHPPVDTAKYAAAPEMGGEHFLIVSRLLGDKRIDLAIEACNRMEHPLRIVGTGPEASVLRKIAGPTITFLGALSDDEVAAEYAACRALIAPGEEDLGIAPLEAMASGRPVVAFGAGGALETVIDRATGILFSDQTPTSLISALQSALQTEFSPQVLRAHAMQFDSTVFQRKMASFVEAALGHERRSGDSNLSLT